MKKIVGLLLLCVTLLLQTAPVKASGNPWYDAFVAYDNSNGGAYYNDTDSGTLAYAESYLLRGYINMYELTRSTSWLNKFKTHVDAMISHASDTDGDGYLGWDTASYSTQQLANNSFETGASGNTTLPAGWTRFQTTSANAYRSGSAGEYIHGSTGLVIKSDTAGWRKVYQTLSSYEPGKVHTLGFMGKTDGSAAKGRAYVYDATTGTTLGFVVVDSTDWQYYNLQFTTPSSGHTLQVWLGPHDYTLANGTIFFDNVKFSPRYPYLVNEAMIGIPIAEFVRLVNMNSTSLSSYVSTANSYQDFLEDEIIAKWHDSLSFTGDTWVETTSTEGYYKEPSTFDSLPGYSFVPLPYNMSLAFTDLQLILHDVNNNSSYLDRANKAVQYWKNRMANNGTGYTWYYWNTGVSPHVEDTSHANFGIAAAVNMFNRGLKFNGSEMNRFANTLVDIMCDTCSTSPLVTDLIDGNNIPSRPGYAYTKILWGWTKLAQFNSSVWPIASKQYSSVTPSSHFEALNLTEIMKWDPVKLVNQGFELKSASDSTLPARWNRFQATSATVYRDTSNKASGDAGVTIVSDGVVWNKLYQQWEEYVPSATYVVTFDGKTDGSYARIWIVNESAGTTITSYSFNNTSYSSHSFTFTAPSSSSSVVKVYLGNNAYNHAGDTAYFDNVVIKKQGDSW